MNLGNNYGKQGQYAEAESRIRQALAVFQNSYGNEHPRTANALTNLGKVLYYQQDYSTALSLLEEAHTVHRELLGDTHINVAISAHWVGKVYDAQGMHDKALDALTFAYDVFETTYTSENRRLADVQIALGTCLTHQQRYDEAEPLLHQGYETLAAAPYAQPDQKQEAREALVALYTAWGKSDQAATYQN